MKKSASLIPVQGPSRKQRKTEREKNRERLRTSGLTGSSPLTRPEAKIILKMPKAEIPNRNFSLRTNPLVLFRRTFKG
jgi:hypothetical protein